jgi:hypothetical protein
LHRAKPITIRFCADDAPSGSKGFGADADLHFGVSSDVLNPMRGIVLGNHVKTPGVLRKPDLDFARTTGPASARAEIKVLLPPEVSHLRPVLLAF